MIAKELAACIEHTLFAADATARDVEALCEEARQSGFLGVCVNGSRVELARVRLEDTNVHVVALVGFPLGAGDADAKRYETEIAVDQGAHEIDYVINHGWLNDGEARLVLREMRDIVEAADERPVKAVAEMDLLSAEEKALFCKIVADSGAHFIGVGTGCRSVIASPEEIRFLRGLLSAEVGIKVSGEIQDEAAAQEFIAAGAVRLGTNSLRTTAG